MKNRERTGLIFIIIGFIILFLLIYFSFFANKKNEVIVETPVSTSTAQLPTGSETPEATTTDTRPRNYALYDTSQEPTHQFNSNDLSKLAMSFAERFGSFSTQSNYGNFTDLKIFMTDSLQVWADGYVEKLRQANTSNSYYGIMTRALTTEVKSFDDKDGKAQVIVTTERSESTETINGGDPYSQKLDLRFLKVNGEWLVDEVYWDKQ
jgi:hypothetical protein